MAVETEGAVIEEARFPGRQGRLLFAYLVAEEGRPVPRDELAEALWPETPPATWEKALTVLASKLRGLLDAELTSAFGCYRLALPEGTWVDVHVAAKAAQEAEDALAEGNPEAAKAAASLAASLVTQPFLPGETGAWVEEMRRSLGDLRVRAFNSLADACLRSGDATESARWAEQTIALEPFRETGYRRLMEALAAAGDRGEALRVYERCRRLLAEELGAYPSPETVSIYRRLLEAPSADAEQPTAPPPPHGRRPRRLLPGAVALGVAAAVAAGILLVTRAKTPALAAVGPDSVAVVDPLRLAVVGDIPLHTRPASSAYGAGSLWVATKDDQTVLQIDPRTRRITRTIGLGLEPDAIAVADGYVWVLCAQANRLFQFDADTGTRVRTTRLERTIAVGPFAGRPLRFGAAPLLAGYNLAAGAGAAWVAYGEDVVARVDADTGAVRQIAAGSASGIAFGDRAAWSSASLLGHDPVQATISRIDARTRAVTAIRIGPVVPDPTSLGLAVDAHGVWGISQDSRRAWKIDPDLARVTVALSLDHQPEQIAAGAGAVWVANADGTLSRIDTSGPARVDTIPLGRSPRVVVPVDLAAGGGAVWIALH